YSKPQIERTTLQLSIAVVLKIHDVIAFVTFRLLYRSIDRLACLPTAYAALLLYLPSWAMSIYFCDAITALTGKNKGDPRELSEHCFTIFLETLLQFQEQRGSISNSFIPVLPGSRALASLFPIIRKSSSLQATHHNSVRQRFIHARYKLRSRTSVEHSSDNDKPSAIQERCSNDAHMLGNYMPPMSSNTVISSSLCSLYGKCPLSCHKDTVTKRGINTYWLCKSSKKSGSRKLCITLKGGLVQGYWRA
uniref:Uncharacterized protein n=1 Tax=Glossina palpalis gambiensis TaxID=67801 RepID=A0A1B0C747_9MUSC